MILRISAQEIPEVKLIEPKKFSDSRGFFAERLNTAEFIANGLDLDVFQIVQSRSKKGVLRGLHFQHPHSQGKLVWVPRGRIWDVAVDIRVGSPYFSCYVAAELSEDNFHMLWIPPGFAHGFATLSDNTDVMYAICNASYVPDCARTIRYDDPDIGIEWPLSAPHVSDKDSHAAPLRDFTPLPSYDG